MNISQRTGGGMAQEMARQGETAQASAGESGPAPGGQPLLFDSLPEAPPQSGRRTRAGRPRSAKGAVTAAASVRVDSVREAVPRAAAGPLAPPPAGTASTAAPLAAPPMTARQGAMALAPSPAPPPPAFDPAALTNPELRALVHGLSDARLGHLLVEAARALKRRVVPDGWDEAEDGPFEPDRGLLRAAAQAVAELSGEDA